MTRSNSNNTRGRMTTYNRRRFLKVTGTSAVLTTALAGCTGGGDGGTGDGADGDGDGADGSDGGDGGDDNGDNGATTGDDHPDTIRLGLVYPLSGAVGETGQQIRSIIDYTVENIVNKKADLAPLILSETEGLPNLGGAKVEVKWADHRGDPAEGRAEAERLIQQEEVSALYGAYHSSVSKTVSSSAERFGVPHLTGESSSPELTERGLKWFFRTGPHDGIFTKNMFDMMDDLNAEGADIQTVGIIHEDTEFGVISKDVQLDLADERGYDVTVGPIAYTAETVSSLSTQVQKLKQADPDILLPTSYAKDGIMLIEEMEGQNWYPDLVIAQDAGFIEPSFVERTDLSNFITSRSTFADDMTDAVPEIGRYNEFIKEGTGISFNGVFIRSWAGILILLKAIDNAGSTEPEAIQESLYNLKLDPIESGLPFGVDFDPETNQNKEASGVIIQFHDQVGRLVWPLELAKEDSLTFPVPGWDER